MNSTVQYTCPMCLKQGSAEYDPQYVRLIDNWLPRLHCNRCADFKSNLARLRDAVKRVCMVILSSQKPDIARPKLTDLTKKIASISCSHYRITNVWEPDFVDELISKPDKSDLIINFYASRIKRIAKDAHNAAAFAQKPTS